MAWFKYTMAQHYQLPWIFHSSTLYKDNKQLNQTFKTSTTSNCHHFIHMKLIFFHSSIFNHSTTNFCSFYEHFIGAIFEEMPLDHLESDECRLWCEFKLIEMRKLELRKVLGKGGFGIVHELLNVLINNPGDRTYHCQNNTIIYFWL